MKIKAQDGRVFQAVGASLVVRGKLLPRTARGKLVLGCDVSGCRKRLLAMAREESWIQLMLRATALSWARVPGHPSVVLCPEHAQRYLP